MGKKAVGGKRLGIHRETLRALGGAALGRVRGGALTTDWVDDTTGATNPKSTAWTGRYDVANAAICTSR